MKRELCHKILGGIISLFLVLLVYSCANMGRPTGGFKDWDPPVYVKSTPPNGAVNHKKQRIEIEFDENIQLNKVNEKVVVSPPQKEKEVVKAMGRKILISLKDTLKENTTYSIDFADAIGDNNENNLLENFAFSFSTGPVIDSLEFSGLLLNARDLEPVTGVFVGLHRNTEDTAFTKLRFDRLSSTDGYGRFTIRNVAEGSYRLYALKDGNRNYIYDMPTEDIAFIDSIFVPSVELHSHQDTVWKDSVTIDTIIDHTTRTFHPSSILLRLFNEEFATLYLDNYSRPERRKIQLDFSTFVEQKPLLKPVNFEVDSLWYAITTVKPEEKAPSSSSGSSSSGGQSTDGPKSLFTVWLSDSLVYKQDSLLIEVSYLRTDSTTARSLFTDTLRFNFKDPKPKKQKERKSKKKEEEKPEPPRPTTMPSPKIAEPSLELFDDVQILYAEPLVSYDTAGFHLEQKQDSLWIPFNCTFEFDSLEQNRITLRPTADWKDTTTYRVKIDSAAVMGIFGLPCKADSGEFKTKSTDEYGNLFFTVVGLDTTAFVELIDESEKVHLRAPVKEGECEFWFVKPAKYYARLVVDLNNDGKWTTGSYKQRRQPEEVYYFESELDVRANWDIEQTWNVRSTAIEKQKPLTITKNLPEEVKLQLNEQKKKTNVQNM